jgi:DNA-binding PadR family transcriptional regulator
VQNSHRAKGEEMKADMRQRSVMQNLSLTEWRSLSRLPVSAGPVMLHGIQRQGWIEIRGVNSRKEIRLTELGLEALRAHV